MCRSMSTLVSGLVLATSLLAGCSDNNSNTPTGPSGGTGGGATPPPDGGSPAPSTASVTVGDIFFRSDHNGSSNPAVDTPSFTSSSIMTGPGTLTRPRLRRRAATSMIARFTGS